MHAEHFEPAGGVYFIWETKTSGIIMIINSNHGAYSEYIAVSCSQAHNLLVNGKRMNKVSY